MLLLKANFFILQNLIPFLLILLLFLCYLKRTWLDFRVAASVFGMLIAKLQVAWKLQSTLRLDALRIYLCGHITAMLRRLVNVVINIGPIILLKNLLLIRHREVHNTLYLRAPSRARVDADALRFLLLNDSGQLVYPPLPLDLMILRCLLVRPVIVPSWRQCFIESDISRVR